MSRHVSLVVPTISRVKELARLLDSLVRQNYQNFEVIVVDQNTDERLAALLRNYQEKLTIRWLRHPNQGVSRARNAGLAQVRGAIVGFPDDDCWYPEDLLRRVVDFFEHHPGYHGLSGRTIDETGRSTGGRWDREAGEVTRYTEWTRSIEPALFFRRDALARVGGFDTSLGPGAGTPWGACEGDDLVLRLLATGYRVFYDPTLVVFHPGVRDWGLRPLRARAYGRGMGRVMRLHGYPWWYLAYWCLRSLGGAGLAAIKGQGDQYRYYVETLKGRIEGWRGQ